MQKNIYGLLPQLAKQHSEWVALQGWTSATTLELLAMVASELGEVEECLTVDGKYSELGSELADVMLRMMHISQVLPDFELSEVLATYVVDQKVPPYSLSRTMIIYGQMINACRKAKRAPNFEENFGQFVAGVMAFAEERNVNLLDEIVKKMAVNKERGSRGRII